MTKTQNEVRAIHLENDRSVYFTGDTVDGIAELRLNQDVPICCLTISLHALGRVCWSSSHAHAPFHLNRHLQWSEHEYLQEEYNISDEDVYIEHNIDQSGCKNVFIQFSFLLPKNKNLPSSVICLQSSIDYFIRVTINEGQSIQRFKRSIIVQAGLEGRSLMMATCSEVSKTVLLHHGKVALQASLARQGFAPGETITVHISVNNQSSATLLPRISLHQMQRYTSGVQQNTVKVICGCDGSNDSSLSNQFTLGLKILPEAKMEQVLTLRISPNESLTVETELITVRYFLHVTLDIPHSFDLHLNFPLVITSTKFIQDLRDENENILPEFI